MYQNQRESNRVAVNMPIQLSFGTQIVLQGQLKDLSLKSAFVLVKSSICMAPNDELSFALEISKEHPKGTVYGTAVISRVNVGEGIAIYFSKLNDAATARLGQIVGSHE